MANDIVFVLKAKSEARQATQEVKKQLDAVGVSVEEVAQQTEAAAAATNEMATSASAASRAFTFLSAAVLKVGAAITAAFAPVLSGVLSSAFAGVFSATLIGRVTLLAAGIATLATAFLGLFVIGEATRAAAGFNAALAETSTLIAGTPDQINTLTEEVQRLISAYGGNAVGQTQAFYQAISAGATDIRDAAVLVEQANQLAVGGITSVETGVDILSTVVNAYGAEAITAQEASDALFVAMRLGKTTVDELANGLSGVIPVARASGVTFDEVTSAVSALTTQGIDTSVAVTQLRAILQGVIRPTEQAQKAAAELGIEFNLAALQAKGLEGFLFDVADAADGNVEKVARLFESVEALGGFLALTGGGAAAFSNALEETANKAGATQEAYDKIAASLSQRLSVSLDRIADVFQRIGGVILAVVVPPLEIFATTLELVANNVDVLIIALGLLSGSLLPALAGILGKVVGLFRGVAAGFGLLATSSTAATVATGAFGSTLATKVLGALNAVTSRIPILGGLLGTLGSNLTTVFSALGLVRTGALAAAGGFSLLGAAMTFLPLAVVTGVFTVLFRVISNSRKEYEALERAATAAKEAQEGFNEAVRALDEARTEETLLAARRASDQLVETLREGIAVAQKELESAEFRTNFFGVTLFETERLREARANLTSLQGQLAEAEAAQSAYEAATLSSADAQRNLNIAISEFAGDRTVQNLQAAQAAARGSIREIEREIAEAQARLEASQFTILGKDFDGFSTSEIRDELSALQAKYIELSATLSALDTAVATAGDSIEAQIETLRVANQVTVEVGSSAVAAVPFLTDLATTYGDLAGTVRETLEVQQQLAAINAQNVFGNALAGASEFLDTLSLTNEETLRLNTEIARIRELDVFSEQADAARDLVAEILAATEGNAELEGNAVKVAEAILDGVLRMAELEANSRGAAGAISGAAGEASRLAANLGQAASLASALQSARFNIGMDTVGLQAQTAALQAGASSTRAAAEGQLAQRAAELERIRGTVEPVVFQGLTRELELYSGALLTNVSAQEDQAAALRAATEAAGGGGSGGGGGGAAEKTSALTDAVEALTTSWRQNAEVAGLSGRALEDYRIRQELLEAAQRDGVAVSEETITALLAQRDAFEQAALASQTFAAGVKAGFEDFKDSVQTNMEFARDFTQNAFRGVSDVISDFVKTGKLSFRDLLADLLGQISSFLANRLLIDFLGINGNFSGGTGGLGTRDFLGSIIGAITGREEGGPVRAGVPYLVGEKRPEVFIPRQNGTIVPSVSDFAAQGGGQRAMSVVFNITTPDADSFRRSEGQISARMAAALAKADRRNN